MKNDPLQQFIAVRASLLDEKAGLLSRLAQIDKALGVPSNPKLAVPAADPKPRTAKSPSQASKPAKRRLARKASVRSRKGPGLHRVILDLLKEKPLTKAEILEGLQKSGRSYPDNYIAVTLSKKGNFKRIDDRFAIPG
jgi:retron-type reverse transcriptase